MTEGFEGRVWMFAETFEVGRGSGRFLADEPGNSVSRLHAAVFPDAAGWWVADRESSNGTWLNGIRPGEQPAEPLRAGDILQFAKLAFRVESAAPRSGAEPTTPPGGA
jgi:pSer/pThr/pTyr-binding forkhead associated (FHA) protein